MHDLRMKMVLERFPISTFMSYREWLLTLYKEIKAEDRSYSYEIMSKQVGLGSKNVYPVLNGKRELTAKTGAKVADALKLAASDKNYLLLLVNYGGARTPAARDAALTALLKARASMLQSDADRLNLQFFSNWYNIAILELLRLEESSDDPEWIASTLAPKISVPKVKHSLALLSKLGYLVYDAKLGRLFPSDDHIKIEDGFKSLAIVSFQLQMIELGKHAVTLFKAKDRDINAVTFTVSESKIAQFKKEMHECRQRLLASSKEDSDQKVVMQMNFQLFPLMKKEIS